MNTSEKESLTEALSSLTSRLEELLRREVQYEEEWRTISGSIKTVHNTFNEVVNAYILQCKLLLKGMDSSFWPYEFFNNFVEYLYRCSFQLRTLYPFVFAPPSPNRLYYYLFLKELLNCFPKSLSMPQDIKYVMIATGDVAHWPIQEVLLGKIKAFEQFLDPEVRKRLQQVRETTISGFECDFEEPLDRQMVLGHEIFHVLVRLNPALVIKFGEIISRGEVKTIFGKAGHPLNLGHIEELFCDFGGARFFGAAYAKAFIEEIPFREKARTGTHPQRVARVLMILNAFPKKKKFHPYLTQVSRYLRAHKDEVNLSREDIEIIGREFRLILRILGLERYKPSDTMDTIKRCIENNIPYIYAQRKQDIRGLLNNLPDRLTLSERAQQNYNEFVFESIRKNIMWYEFTNEAKKLKAKLPPTSNTIPDLSALL